MSPAAANEPARHVLQQQVKDARAEISGKYFADGASLAILVLLQATANYNLRHLAEKDITRLKIFGITLGTSTPIP